LKVSSLNDENTFNQYCRFVLRGENDKTLYITVIYRSPNSSETNTNLLCELINNLDNDKNNLVIGDFNLPKIDWNTSSADGKGRQLLETLDDNFFTQIIDFPTHNRGNILDLALLNKPDTLINASNIGNLGNSDHAMIMLELIFDMGVPYTDEMVPDWRGLDEDGFNDYLDNFNWQQSLDSTSAQASWTTFTKVINEGMEYFVPKKL